jgi:serine/threonine protein kinase
VLAAPLAASSTARQRFLREARAAAAVRDDHVVAIHDVCDDAPVPYLVMEYIDGCNLEALLRRGGRLEVPEILRIGSEIARGLSAAHQHGLTHRDIKPANILLESGRQRVKLTDFGLARAADDVRLTQSGLIAGTPLYMAPEQATGEPIDVRADLFSFGSVLYELCTGQPAFEVATNVAVLRRVCDETPRPIRDINADLPEPLYRLIERLQIRRLAPPEEKPKALPPAKSSSGTAKLYLICDPQDEEAVAALEDYLFAQGLEVLLPAFDGDDAVAAALHQENLLSCNAVLVYYGRAPRAWVDIKLRELLKAAGYGRDAPIAVQAVYARENLLATLSRSHFGLVEAVKQAGLGAGTNFLLVVDQFEEIFRFHEAGQVQQEAANEFVSLLLEAVAQKEVPIFVVLTMRSDFIGECSQFEGLAERVNRGEFLIPRLTREQYKHVIEGPIKVAGGKIAPRLLQRLLNDLSQQPDQLPCLQHALMRTWSVWAGDGSSWGAVSRPPPNSRAIDLDDYQRVGKMVQALSHHADEIYETLASDLQRALCQGMCKR